MNHSDIIDRILNREPEAPTSVWVVARPSTVPEAPRQTEVLSPWVRRNLDNEQTPKVLSR